MRIKLSGSKQLSNIFKGCGSMIYVGIDIAKQKHFAAAMTADGEVLISPFGFTNDSEGFKLFLSKLKTFEKSSILIGLESTAHYAENLVCHLFDLGYRIAVINPIQTATLRKTNIRKTKTDKVDTLLIIKSMIVNNHRLYSKTDIDSLRLKSLCRFREKIKKSKSRLKIQLVTYVDVLFPELQYFFKSGIHINTCYELLKKHSAPDDIAALHLTYLGNLLQKASHGRFGKEEAAALKGLAKSSVGTGNTSVSIQITQSISQIELLEKQLAELDEAIKNIMLEMNPVILTIPGIGFLNGAMILGEVGDVLRFQNPCKLLAYAGLDPTVNQSGKFNAKSTRMSKRGSKLLRYALINAAWNVSLNNKTFGDYFKLKLAQGNNHYAALGHVAHKLVRIIFKMLKDNVAFNLN
jgi:transposase